MFNLIIIDGCVIFTKRVNDRLYIEMEHREKLHKVTIGVTIEEKLFTPAIINIKNGDYIVVCGKLNLKKCLDGNSKYENYYSKIYIWANNVIKGENSHEKRNQTKN